MQKTVLLPDVLAEQTTYSASFFASVVVNVRMMKTHRTTMKLMLKVMVMICKDSLVA